jgi:hypothetical protein
LSWPPKPGDPVELGLGVLGHIPSYARVRAYNQARRVLDVARLAHAALPAEAAMALTRSLIADVPALQAALANQASGRNPGG